MFGVITGAASGIGRAVADRLSAQGWLLALLDQDGPNLADAGRSFGDRHLVAEVDVSARDEMVSVAQTVCSPDARVDLLFVNAGIATSDSLSPPDPATWQRTLDVNLTGAYNTISAFEGALGEGEGHGAIVVSASVLGIRGSGSMLSYSVSKAGLSGLTQAVAQAVAPRGITANAIAPGPVQTPILRAASSSPGGDVADHVPLRRLGRVEEIAGVVEFLASSDASFITGQVIAVDGGLSSVAYWRP